MIKRLCLIYETCLTYSLIDAIHKAMHGDELYNFGSKHIKRFLCLN